MGGGEGACAVLIHQWQRATLDKRYEGSARKSFSVSLLYNFSQVLLIKYNDDHEDLVMWSTQPKLGAGFRSAPVYFVYLKQNVTLSWRWWLPLLWSLFIIWWVPFLAVLCDWCEEMKPSSWCDIMCVLSFFFFGCTTQLMSSQVPYQGLNPGPSPEGAESQPPGHQGIP